MARKGIERVKTGCKTCKIRKVKCDEGHPQCVRCLSTGRQCDGYAAATVSSYSWSQLLSIPLPPAHVVSKTDRRALSFFRHVAAPSLAGPLDSHFWTHIVLQVADQEPAAKHAVLAISAFYEDFQHGSCHSMVDHAGAQTALWHYNNAVTSLRTTRDPSLMLLMCLLFICIEFLRANHENAISHCRHAINMLNQCRTKSKLVRDYLDPAFSRLSIFPFFFGVSPETFPCRDTAMPTIIAPFQTLHDAHSALGPLLVRAVRFVRRADSYRLGVTPQQELDSGTQNERQTIEEALDRWFAMFHLSKLNVHPGMSDSSINHLVQMQWLVGKIWIATCLTKEETAYDVHMDKFRAILDLARRAAAARTIVPTDEHHLRKFTVEMGFTPLLAFVMIKCRCLHTRMAAMELMQSVSFPRESLWDYDVLLAMGRRTIEVEHDLKLAIHAMSQDFAIDRTKPAEYKRIKDSFMEHEVAELHAQEGSKIVHRKICFLIGDPIGQALTTRDEWLSFKRL